MKQSREDRLASEVASRLAGCPDADALLRFQAEDVDDATRQRVGAHLDSCTACRDALEFLRAEDRSPMEPPFAVEKRIETLIRESARRPTGAVSWWSPRMLRAAAAVALFAAIAVGGYRWLGPRPGGDLGALRGDEPLTLVSPVGRLEIAPARMVWVALAGASAYRVTLFDEKLEEVWSRRTGGDESVLPLDESLRAALAPGRPFTWRVEALDEFGATVESSPAAHFEVESDERARSEPPAQD